MVTASRMHNMVPIRKKNAYFLTRKCFRLFIFFTFKALGVKSPRRGAILLVCEWFLPQSDDLFGLVLRAHCHASASQQMSCRMCALPSSSARAIQVTEKGLQVSTWQPSRSTRQQSKTVGNIHILHDTRNW